METYNTYPLLSISMSIPYLKYISNLYLLFFLSASLFLIFFTFSPIPHLPSLLSLSLFLSRSALEYLNFNLIWFHLVYCAPSFRILRSSILGGDISWHSFWAGFFLGPAVCRLCGLLWVTWALPEVLFASVSQSRFNFVHASIPRTTSSCFTIICLLFAQFVTIFHPQQQLDSASFSAVVFFCLGEKWKAQQGKVQIMALTIFTRRSLMVVSPPSPVPSPECIHGSITAFTLHVNKYTTRGRGEVGWLEGRLAGDFHFH